tara:strand:- start:1009 stop:1365 length:357 start_codon:yes stop_codon:yes gene_type:complete
MNNKYLDCPSRMDDGRHFTEYRSSCFLNNYTRFNNDIRNSYQYRLFLTRNAEKIMEQNKKLACDNQCCKDCNGQTMLPEESMVECNEFTCNVKANNPNGLGQGRNYGNDKAKSCNWGQ